MPRPHTIKTSRRRRVLALLIPVVVLAASACTVDRRVAEDLIESHTEGTFYTLPSPLPTGGPGTLIRSERLLGAPDGAIAWRVLYLSTDLNGAPMGVSGVIVSPVGPGPAGGRVVVSWAHPTTGSSGRCAPSVGVDPFLLMEGLHELLAAGYVVAATDYPGMGANGPPSYLIGTSEGNSVLDAARAARLIPDTHASDRLVVWGHSQGGQAALFAAQDATTYAPELHLIGAAVAAPATELGVLLDDHQDDVSGVTIGSYAFDAFERVYGADDPKVQLSTILTPAAIAALPKMTPLCLLGQMKEIHALADPLIGKFLASDPNTTEPWKSLLAENTPGAKPIGVPMFVAQGEADELVKPTATAQYVQGRCAAGEHVDFRTYPGINHGEVADRALFQFIPWINDVVDGRTTPSTCG